MVVAAAAGVLAVMLATGPQATEPPAPAAVPDAAALPISLDRIRDALERPQLVIPPPESLATFKISVEEKAPAFESVLEGMRRDLARWSGAGSTGPHAPHTNSLPAPKNIGGVDLLPIAAALKKKWNELKAERIHRDVTEELAAFCKVNDCSVLEGGVPTSPEGIVTPPQPD